MNDQNTNKTIPKPWDLKCLSRIYYKPLRIDDGDPTNPQVSIPWSWNREGAEINPSLWLWFSANWCKYEISKWEVGKTRIQFGGRERPVSVDPICDASLDLDKVVTFEIREGFDIHEGIHRSLRDCTGWQVLYILLDPLKDDVDIDWTRDPPKDIVVLVEMNWDGWTIFVTCHNEKNQPISGYIRPMNSEGDAYFISHVGTVSKNMPRYELMTYAEKQFLETMYDGKKIKIQHPYSTNIIFETRLRLVLIRESLDSPEQQKSTEKSLIWNGQKPRRHTVDTDKQNESVHTAGSWWGHMAIMSQYIIHSTVKYTQTRFCCCWMGSHARKTNPTQNSTYKWLET